MHKPLLFIHSPTFFQPYVKQETITKEPPAISTEQKVKPLVQQQLQFFHKLPKHQRKLHILLMNGEEFIGTLLDYENDEVKLEMNDQYYFLKAYDIRLIRRMPN